MRLAHTLQYMPRFVAATVALCIFLGSADPAFARKPVVANGDDNPSAEDLERLASNFGYAKEMLDVLKPFVPHTPDQPVPPLPQAGAAEAASPAERMGRVIDFFDYAEKFAELAAAIRADLEEKRSIWSDQSHTLGKLAELEFSFYADPKRLQDLQNLGIISKSDALRWAPLGLFGLGGIDMTTGLATAAGSGHFTADSAASGLDGAVATLWGSVGWLIFHDWDVANAFASAARLTTSGVRFLSLPFFERQAMRESGTDSKIIELWEEAQRRKVARGERPVPIQEFFKDTDVLGRIRPDLLVGANARFNLPPPAPIDVWHRTSRESYEVACTARGCMRTDLGGAHETRPATPADLSNIVRDQTEGRRPLGGVRIDAPLKGAALKGVTLDVGRGRIILVGERDLLARGLAMSDLAEALWLEYQQPQPQNLEFSLDPDDRNNPSGPLLRAVYIPPLIKGRSIGRALFDADVLLKELSFECRRTAAGKLVDWTSKVPGFRSYAKMAMESGDSPGEQSQWSRFWIVAQDVTARRSGDSLIFDARLAVRAMRQVPDPTSPSGLRDVPTPPDSLETRWATQVTDRFDELARGESFELQRLVEVAKAVGIAKELRRMGIAVDLRRLGELVNTDQGLSVAKMGTFGVTWKSEKKTPIQDGARRGIRTEIHELHLTGGVDFSTVKPRTIPDDGRAARLDKAVAKAFRMATPGAQVVRFEYDRADVVAVALPLLSQSDSRSVAEHR